MRKLLFGFILIAGLLGAKSAQADTVTTFTSLSAWQTAMGTGIATEDFSDATLAAGLSASFGSNATVVGGLLDIEGQFYNLHPSVFTFNPATAGFGGDFDLTPGGNGGGLDLAIGFSNGTTTDAFFGGIQPEFNGFFGVVSNGAAITSVTLKGAALTGNGESFTLDNLAYGGTPTGGVGGTTPVPEPSSVLLLGSAFGILFLLKSRSV